MSLMKEIRNIPCGIKNLRDFGVVVGSVIIVIDGWLWFKHDMPFLPLAYVGTSLILLGILFPKSLYYPNKAWMTLALILGWIMSHVILTVFFFLIVTPIALGLRFTGKKFLDTKIDSKRTSYWEVVSPKSNDVNACKRQF